jgi:hypothetical protein
MAVGPGTLPAGGLNPLPQIGAHAGFGLYVPLSGAQAGNLCVFYAGTLGTKLYIWLEASAPMLNL